MSQPLIRPLRPADLPVVAAINEAAFGGILEQLYGRRPPRVFAPDLFADRLARDPAGCLVAEAAGQLVGSLFSVHWGSLAWFGPLAVDPVVQNRATGQALVAACLDYWERLGVTVGGLETFPQSPLHLHVYSKLGFAPLGLSLGLEKPLDGAAAPTAWPADVVRWSELTERERELARAAVDRLADRILPGFRPSGELSARVGHRETLGLRQADQFVGFAVCLLTPHRRPGRATIDVPLAVLDPTSAGPADLDTLLAGVAALGREIGAEVASTRVYGQYQTAYQTLVAAGYRITGSSVRMKRGAVAYDRPDLLLLDNWL